MSPHSWHAAVNNERNLLYIAQPLRQDRSSRDNTITKTREIRIQLHYTYFTSSRGRARRSLSAINRSSGYFYSTRPASNCSRIYHTVVSFLSLLIRNRTAERLLSSYRLSIRSLARLLASIIVRKGRECQRYTRYIIYISHFSMLYDNIDIWFFLSKFVYSSWIFFMRASWDLFSFNAQRLSKMLYILFIYFLTSFF